MRIYWRASLMPAVAVTSAPEAYTYIAALRGLSIGYYPGRVPIDNGQYTLGRKPVVVVGQAPL